MAWSTDAEDAGMLVEVTSSMNNVIRYQFALSLVDTFLDKMPQIFDKSLLYFVKFGKLTAQKSPKFGFVKFWIFTCKIVQIIHSVLRSLGLKI